MARLGRARPQNWLLNYNLEVKQPGFYPFQVDFNESGTGTDTLTVPQETLSIAETGTGTDSIVAGINIPESESGTGSDALSVTTYPAFPLQPLTFKIELLLNGVWTDITTYVYSRNPISVGRGRPNEASTAQPSQMTLTLNNRDGRFSPKNSGGAYYPYITRNVQIRAHIVTGSTDTSGDIYSGYRFWGEVSSWPPQWDPSATDIYVQVTASGILRRYQQSKKFSSALRNYWTTRNSPSDPLVYYPMEDTGIATGALNVSGNAFAAGYISPRITNTGTALEALQLMFFEYTGFGTIQFASNTAFAGSDPLPALNEEFFGLQYFIKMSSYTELSITFLLDVPSGGITDGTNILGFFPNYVPGSGVDTIQLNYHTGGNLELLGIALGTTVIDSGLLSVGVNGTPIIICIEVSSGTPGTVSLLTIKPGLFQSITTQYTNSTQTVIFNGSNGYWISGFNSEPAGATVMGHMAITDFAPDLVSIAAAAGGYAGEPALLRFDRLCLEAGITTPTRTDYNVVMGGGGTLTLPLGGYAPSCWWILWHAVGYAFAYNYGTANADTMSNVTYGNPSAPVMILGAGGVEETWGCASFNGTSSKVTSTYNPSGISAITLTAWVNLNISAYNLGTTDAHIVANSHTSSDHLGFSLLLSGGNIPQVVFGNGTTSATVTSANPILPYGWYFLAATWNGTTITLYVNGQSVGTASLSGTLAAGTDDVSLGYNPVINGDWYAGLLSQVAVIQSVLTAAQIQALWLLSTGAQMDGQGSDTFLNLIQEIENLDRGQIYETRNMLGLDYLTRAQLQHQSVAATYDYSAADLAQTLAPTVDDQLSRNDVTLTQSGGSSSTVEVTSGALSTASPPNGIGDYAYSLTVASYSGLQLFGCATWITTVGTVDEYRYPVVTIDLARTEVNDLLGTTANLDIGQFFEIINPPSFVNTATVKQLCWGFSETFGPFGIWTIAINGVPESPYEGSNLPTW